MSHVPENHDEIVNVYDGDARVTGTLGRREAKSRGLILGAVHALVVNSQGEVLLQRRLGDKENGARWDKTVGGHVGAGEEFDQTIVREAGEELFDEGSSDKVVLASDPASFADLIGRNAVLRQVVLRAHAVHKGLRDVRVLPGGGFRNATYHVGIYIGRTDLPHEAFRPQASEIADLRFHRPDAVDRMLLDGDLAPNMAFLWLAHGGAALSLVSDPR